MPFSKENGKDYNLLTRGNIKQLQRVTMMAFISTAYLVSVQRNVLSVSFWVHVCTKCDRMHSHVILVAEEMLYGKLISAWLRAFLKG